MVLKGLGPRDQDVANSRIAILLPSLAPGGAERVALALADGFRERGYQVDMVLLTKSGELLSLLRSDVEVVELGASSIFGAFFPLIAYLRRRRPAAIQVHMWPLTSMAILAAKWVRGTRAVAVEHCVLSEQYKSPKMRVALRRTTRMIYALADALVAVSKGVADDLSKISGIRREAIDVVANPVAIRPLPPPDPDIERLWNGSRRRIITVGQLKAQKNHAFLIDAFEKVRRTVEAKLMLVGQGSLSEVLRRQVARLGLEDDVIFAGFQIDPLPYLASANVFALSSDDEGFGLVLVEAMSAGLSIVSTDCPTGPREVLADGKFGALVQLGDVERFAAALITAFDAVPDRKALAERAAQLSGAHVIDRHLDILLGPAGRAQANK